MLQYTYKQMMSLLNNIVGGISMKKSKEKSKSSLLEKIMLAITVFQFISNLYGKFKRHSQRKHNK